MHSAEFSFVVIFYIFLIVDDLLRCDRSSGFVNHFQYFCVHVFSHKDKRGTCPCSFNECKVLLPEEEVSRKRELIYNLLIKTNVYMR